MPHADSSFIPSSITTKTEFWNHVHAQLEALLDGQRSWVTNLSNASSLIFNSLLTYPTHFGSGAGSVNWCGFYLSEEILPQPRYSKPRTHTVAPTSGSKLILGPFCGKPACQFIVTSPLSKAKGVCADAFIKRETIVVDDVEAYPGHIACDGETKSEIVCPLILRRQGEDAVTLGVLDLDCLKHRGFDEDDKIGLENIVELIISACDW